MKARHAAAVLIPLALGGCGTNSTIEAAANPTTATADASASPTAVMTDVTPDPSLYLLPAGTRLHLRLTQPVGVLNRAKDTFFRTEVIEPIRTADGETVIPMGTIVTGVAHGPVMAQSPHPAILRMEFESLTFEGLTYPVDAQVVGVDLALADSDVSTPMAGHAIAGTAEAMTPGAIVTDPNGRLSNRAFAFEEGTIISLGDASDAMLPVGTRLMIELVTDTQLHSSAS
jgi:hypothetical protein